MIWHKIIYGTSPDVLSYFQIVTLEWAGRHIRKTDNRSWFELTSGLIELGCNRHFGFLCSARSNFIWNATYIRFSDMKKKSIPIKPTYPRLSITCYRSIHGCLISWLVGSADRYTINSRARTPICLRDCLAIWIYGGGLKHRAFSDRLHSGQTIPKARICKAHRALPQKTCVAMTTLKRRVNTTHLNCDGSIF